MAFLSFGKKKKEKEEGFPLQQVSAEQINAMRQQGYNDAQIAQVLQSQGYDTTHVYDAINQANIAGMGSPPEYYQQPQPYGYESQQQPAQGTQPQAEKEKIEEIAEVIIDEKWKEFESDIKRVIEWKERSEARMAKIEQQLTDLMASVASLQKGIMGKIGEYDRNLIDVGTEIKAMEKVFQKILPSLTENVSKLERMTKGKGG